MRKKLLPGLVMLSFLGPLLLPIKATPSTLVTSPDHPSVWAAYDCPKLAQQLWWNEKHQTLFLDVTYSCTSTPSPTDASDYRTYTLGFPSVHRDRASHQLYFVDPQGHAVVLGKIESEAFGDRVVLGRNVELSAHRRNGVIQARFVSTKPSQQ